MPSERKWRPYVREYVKAVFLRWWWLVVGIAWTVLGVLDALGLSVPRETWLGVGVLGIFVAMFLAYANVAGERDTERKHVADMGVPHLKFVYWNTASTYLRSKNQYWAKSTGRIIGRDEMVFPELEAQPLYVHVANDPPGRRPEAIAEDAVIYLAFFAEGSEDALVEGRGRWAENPQGLDLQPGEPEATIYRRTLPPNGDRHKIDVAVIIKSTGEMFVSNDDFWRTTDPKWKLAGSAFLVRVTIKATGLATDKVGWFRLTRLREADADGNLMKLEPLPDYEPVTSAP